MIDTDLKALIVKALNGYDWSNQAAMHALADSIVEAILRSFKVLPK